MTQSMPFSRTKKDYVGSVLAVLAIAGSTAAAVYYSRPNAAIMRQPRMTIVLAIGAIALVTAFIFVARPALPFFSRPLSWGAVVVSLLGLAGTAFFTDKGNHGAWFRFFVLCTVITLGATVLAEAMIFYRRFFHEKKFFYTYWHRIIFTLVITAIVAGGASLYYHNAMKDGLFIDYGGSTFTPTQLPTPTTLPTLTTTTAAVTSTTAAP